MAMIKVSIEYELEIDIDDSNEDLFNNDFNKLRSKVKSDSIKFISENKDNPNFNYKEKIIYELKE